MRTLSRTKRSLILGLAAAAALAACGGGGGGGAPPAPTLQISSVQDLGGGRLGVTVTNASGLAITSLDAPDFKFAVGTQPLALTSVTYTNVAATTSVALALDASGSMRFALPSTCVDPSCRATLSYAAQATHSLLDGLSTAGVSQAGIVLFSSTLLTMNDETFAAPPFEPLWVTPSGAAAAPYAFSATGLTTQFAQLRPVVDLYNAYSDIYLSSAGNGDDMNPTTLASNVRLRTQYVTEQVINEGGTRLFDGISAAVSLLGNATNERKIIIAMTDGKDTASSLSTAVSVVAQAKAAGIPLYLVGFGNQEIDQPTMESMAQQSGGQYRRTEGDLTGLFNNILADLSFQYVAQLTSPPVAGSKVTVSVTQGGETVTRELIIRP